VFDFITLIYICINIQADCSIEDKRTEFALVDDNPCGVALFENMAVEEVKYQVQKTCVVSVIKIASLLTLCENFFYLTYFLTGSV
jgi:hypothetical protein